MKKFNLKNFKGGWIVGSFDPSIFTTKNFEVSIKHYNASQYEKTHTHKISDEITIIVSGTVMMNGVRYTKDDIILIGKGESTNFLTLTDVTTCVIKIPSAINDKYIDE